MEYFVSCEVGEISWVSISEHDYIKFCDYLISMGFTRNKTDMYYVFDKRVWFDSFSIVQDIYPYEAKVVAFRIVEYLSYELF